MWDAITDHPAPWELYDDLTEETHSEPLTQEELAELLAVVERASEGGLPF